VRARQGATSLRKARSPEATAMFCARYVEASAMRAPDAFAARRCASQACLLPPRGCWRASTICARELLALLAMAIFRATLLLPRYACCCSPALFHDACRRSAPPDPRGARVTLRRCAVAPCAVPALRTLLARAPHAIRCHASQQPGCQSSAGCCCAAARCAGKRHAQALMALLPPSATGRHADCRLLAHLYFRAHT